MYATHRPAVVPPRPKRDYLASFSSALIISTLRHSCRNACIYIYIYISFSFLSLSLLARSVPRLFLSFIFIHRLSTRPSTSVLRSSLSFDTQLRYEASCLLVRFTLDRSYFLSRLSAATPSSQSSVASAVRSLARSLARVPSTLLPVPPTHPTHASGSVSSVPFASFSNLRRQCCAAVTRSERGGPGPETRGAAMLTRSARSLASPRLALPRFACGASSSSAARSVLSSSSSSLSLDVAAALLLIVRAAAGRVRTCPM